MSIEFTKNSEWQMEYYYPFPNVRVRFTVIAKTYEEAISKANSAMSEMRMSACYRLKEVDNGSKT